MAPGLLNDDLPDRSAAEANGKNAYPQPLKLSGALNKYKFEDITPAAGREYLNVNIVDELLQDDAALRDLAITISQRSVVFFRAQNNLTDELQKEFVHKLGLLSGKPKDSTLHIHPVLNNTSEFGVADAEISTISSEARKKFFGGEQGSRQPRRYDAATWHADIQFERKPADYTSLRLTKLPFNGGDTLFASGVEIFDRFSKPYQKFLEGLTGTFVGDGFHKAAAANPDTVHIHEGPRGAPENVDQTLSAVHPVVRTNPVTGWKSVFALGTFPKYINELHAEESDELLAKLRRTVLDSHDLTVRFKWKNENDIGKWFALPSIVQRY
nr:hypothetical protein B0A51_03214 [Rachicladosporium sp. CCFEE 5018]